MVARRRSPQRLRHILSLDTRRAPNRNPNRSASDRLSRQRRITRRDLHMPMKLAFFAVLSLAAACERTPAAPVTLPRPTESAPAVAAVAELPADVSAAFDQLQGHLKERLLAEIARVGPAAAIDVCKTEAPQLTAAQSTPTLRVGRTSVALRNPANQPPAWAQQWVRDQGRRKVAGGAKLASVALPNGGTGYLRAIGVAPVCLACHGPGAALPDALRARLSESYPADAAVDFAEGDLRGWFWAEREASPSK